MKLICLADESREVVQLSDCLTVEWTLFLSKVCVCVSLCPIILKHSQLGYSAVIHLGWTVKQRN